jgi:cysteinyl-tRNA synthetase
MVSEQRLKQLIATLIVGLILLTGCSEKSVSPPANKKTSANKTSTSKKNFLKKVKFWAYQIQDQHKGRNIQKLAASHYDLLVIDQTRSLQGEETYDSKRDVSLLKKSANSSGGRKIVVCYLDVGEAESYRWYWQKGWGIGNPEWIVSEDPDGWDENYPVKLWREEWKNIMKKYLDRIIADGYDGVYLDWLEIYSFQPVADAADSEGLNSQGELIKFVRELSQHARSKNPNFLFIAQNASELAEFPEYVRLFDAIAQEAIWYDGEGDPDTEEQPGDVQSDPEYSEEYLNNLKSWQKRGKPVFNAEYAQEPSNTQRAYRLGNKYGFKTYVTLRPLGALTHTPPPGY